MEFLVLKPSINLFLRNKENKTAYDLCKNDTKMFFEKLMLKKKQLCEKNNDVLINNAYPSSSKVQVYIIIYFRSKIMILIREEYLKNLKIVIQV